MTDLIIAKDCSIGAWKSCASSTTLGENSSWTLQLCDWKKNEFDVYVTTSDTKEENELKSVSTETHPYRNFCHKSVVSDSSTTALGGYVGLLSTASYPANSMQVPLVYVLPAIRETTHSTSSLHIYKIQLLPTKDGAFQDSNCVQRGGQGTLVPLSHRMVSCRLSIKSEACRILYRKLAKIRFWPGQHQDTLASHKMMILQNRVGLGLHSCNTRGSLYHYRSECCTGVNGSNRELEQNPTRHSWSFRKITPDDWR